MNERGRDRLGKLSVHFIRMDPLKNLLVVDLTRVLVGPYCTTDTLLRFRCESYSKIEAPETGDDLWKILDLLLKITLLHDFYVAK